jgi:hypothetical protein
VEIEMNEQRDDTTERDAPSPARREESARHSYYYDDATGYEIYDPSDEDEGEGDEPADDAADQSP